MIRTSDMTFAKNVLGSWSKILQDGKSPDDPHAYNYEYQTPQYQDGEIASVVAYIFDFFDDPNAGDYYLALICFYDKVGHEYRRKLLYRYCYRQEDLDKFKKMVGDFASDQQMRLNQQMQFELDEDDPVPDREDSYDQILQELNSGRTASRRKAHDYYQPDLGIDDIKWYELEPGYEFDTEEIDGERAIKAWQPDVNVDVFSIGTVYQLDDGRFKAVGNDEFTGLMTLGYFDNIEEAKQAVIKSMEADGWLPEYRDVANMPNKHTGPLPARKAINMNCRAAKWNPDDYLPDDGYGIHLSNDEKFGLAVLSAFEDAYGNEYTYTDGGPGDADGEVEGVYEHNGRPHLFIELTINHHKCRVAYASDDVNVEEDADVIRLDSDPARSAEMIHDTVENYIDEVYLNPDDYHYDDEF